MTARGLGWHRSWSRASPRQMGKLRHHPQRSGVWRAGTRSTGDTSLSLTWWTSTKHWLQFEWLFLLQEAHLNLLGWVRCPPLAPPPLCWVLLYRHCHPHLPESSMRAEKRLPHLCGPSAPPGTEQRHALWEGAKRPTCLHPPLSRPQSECWGVGHCGIWGHRAGYMASVSPEPVLLRLYLGRCPPRRLGRRPCLGS